MQLTDGIVTLRPPCLDDAPVVAAAVAASLPELEPWMPWASPDYDTAAAVAWIEGTFDATERTFVILGADGSYAGSCGLNRVDDLNRAANLGYWLSTPCTGRGLATRAARLLARHGIADLGFHRLEVIMSVRNGASRAVAERMGACHEGVMRGHLLLRGEFHDAHLYSVVAGDLA